MKRKEDERKKKRNWKKMKIRGFVEKDKIKPKTHGSRERDPVST